MSNVDLDLDDLDDGTDDADELTTIQRQKAQIRELKKREKQLQQEADSNAEAKKKLAFIEAKLPDEPQVKFFLDHYEGDYDPEAIREAAASYGFITPDRQTTDDVNAVEQMMNANSGSNSLANPGSDRELMDRINAVKPGPNASKQIRDIMAAAGRYESDE